MIESLAALALLAGGPLCDASNSRSLELTVRYEFNEVAEEPDILRWDILRSINAKYPEETVRSNQIGVFWDSDPIRITVHMDINCDCRSGMLAEAVGGVLITEMAFERLDKKGARGLIRMEQIIRDEVKVPANSLVGRRATDCRQTFQSKELFASDLGGSEEGFYRLTLRDEESLRGKLSRAGIEGITIVPAYLKIRTPASARERAVSTYVRASREHANGNKVLAIGLLKKSIAEDDRMIRPRMLLAAIYEKERNLEDAARVLGDLIGRCQNAELRAEQERRLDTLKRLMSRDVKGPQGQVPGD